MKKVVNWFIYLFLIILIIRLCFFDIFRVPSGSMQNALNAGDLIIVNSTLYSGTFSPLFFKLKIKPSPRVNDVLVFKISQSDSIFYVKRCIGLPGETIEIINDKVFVNDKYMEEPATVIHLYKVWYVDYRLIENTLNKSKIDLSNSDFQRQPKYIAMRLSDFQKHSLLGQPGIDSITVFNTKENRDDFLSNILKYGHSTQNLKPFLIPFTGMKIKLDSNTFKLYKEIFKKDEHVQLEQRNIYFFVDGVKQQYYIFKNNYYFMMGDNREKSMDSRFFGPISQGCIKGKVVLKI